jgi:hypothetical protein
MPVNLQNTEYCILHALDMLWKICSYNKILIICYFLFHVLCLQLYVEAWIIAKCMSLNCSLYGLMADFSVNGEIVRLSYVSYKLKFLCWLILASSPFTLSPKTNNFLSLNQQEYFGLAYRRIGTYSNLLGSDTKLREPSNNISPNEIQKASSLFSYYGNHILSISVLIG